MKTIKEILKRDTERDSNFYYEFSIDKLRLEKSKQDELKLGQYEESYAWDKIHNIFWSLKWEIINTQNSDNKTEKYLLTSEQIYEIITCVKQFSVYNTYDIFYYRPTNKLAIYTYSSEERICKISMICQKKC